MRLTELAEFLGISLRHAKDGRAQLARLGLIVRLRFGRTAEERRETGTRLALSIDGLRYLSWRDRTRLSDLTAFWGIHPDKNGDDALKLASYRIRGSKLRVLTRELRHTDGVHHFVSTLNAACRATDEWKKLDLIPPHRWERWFHYNNRRYGLKPDATGQYTWRGIGVSLLLEYEERAIGPTYMRDRLIRYQRYYHALETSADFDGRWAVLVIFDDAASASRFSTLSARHMRRGHTISSKLPLFVSSSDVLKRDGVLKSAWVTPGNLESGRVGLDTAASST